MSMKIFDVILLSQVCPALQIPMSNKSRIEFILLKCKRYAIHPIGLRQTWDSKMTSKIFIDMAASFWFFLSFLAKSISFYFRNQIYTALGFQKYSHCNKVLYISPWTIPFYTSDVSLLTKKSLIFAIFYKCESGVLLKYDYIYITLR